MKQIIINYAGLTALAVTAWGFAPNWTAGASPSNAAEFTPASEIEENALAYAEAAADGWEGIGVQGVADLGTVSSMGGAQIAADIGVQYGAFPDALIAADGTPGPLTIGLVSNAPGITDAEVAAYTASVAGVLRPADHLVWIQWASTDLGEFNSIVLMNLGRVKWDSFATNMPATWPPSPDDQPGGGLFFSPDDADEDAPPPGWTWEITNGFGVTAASMSSSVSVQCNGGEVVTCSSSDDSSSTFLWDAQVDTQCEVVAGGQCCFCEVAMAYSSGFRSIGAEGGGFGLEVTGSLGVGGAIKRQQQKCCEDTAD